MNHAITTQLEFFLISILWGAIILVAYDVFRILRRLIKHNSIFLAVEDLIFWVTASVFIFAMIYNENDGIIRGFSVMGVTIGMVLYHYILSSFLVNTITKLIQTLLRPFTIAINMVKRFFRFVFLKGKKIVNFFTRRLKKLWNSYKIKLDAKRKVVAAKRAIKAEKKANEKKKKDEQKLAKRKGKAGPNQPEEQLVKPVPISKANQSMQPILGNKAQQRLLREKKLEAERSLAREAFISTEKSENSSADHERLENPKKDSGNNNTHSRKAEKNKKELQTRKSVKGK